jgi:malate/lactate dehydrogenase
MKSVSIIGIGRVGAELAFCLMQNKKINKIFLIDRDDLIEKVKGIVLDISSAFPESHFKLKLANYDDVNNSDLIVITAGVARKEGNVTTRDELLCFNKKIIDEIIKKLKPKKDTIIIVVTNPVDIISYYVFKSLNLNPNQIIGFGGSLDSNRLKYLLSLQTMKKKISCFVIGEHGEGMIPIFDERVKNYEEIRKNLRNYASEVISRTGGTIYGPAFCLSELIDAIIRDKREVFCVSCYQEKDDLFIEWPCLIGKNGIMKKIDLQLNEKSKEMLDGVKKKIKEKILSLF